MEDLKKLLLEMGVESSTVEVLAATEKPEGFDLDETIQAALKEREDFNVIKLTPSIEEAYKERTGKATYATTIKPIQARLDKQLKSFGATEEQLKAITSDVGVDPKKAIDLIGTLTTTSIKNASTQKEGEALTAALADLEKYKTVSSERMEAIEARDAQIEGLKTSSAKDKADFINGYELKSYFSETLQSEAFTGIKKVADLPEIMDFYMKKRGYDIRRDAPDKPWKATSADGTPAIRIDGGNTYKSPEEMLVDIARHAHLYPEHKGGEDRQIGTHERVVSGKKIQTGGASFLQENM